jgi:hypothetical protein
VTGLEPTLRAAALAWLRRKALIDRVLSGMPIRSEVDHMAATVRQGLNPRRWP